MAAMTEAVQVGKFKELEDDVFNVDPAKTPFTGSIAKRGKILVNTTATWVAEKYPAAIPTPKVDGAATTAFNRVDRKELEGYIHYFDSPYKVTNVAELLATAGVRDEVARQRANALTMLRRMMEVQALSVSEMAADNGSSGYTMRGAFKWLSASAQATKPVDSTLRPASANSYTGAFASFDEAALMTMLNSMFSEVNAPLTLDAHLGIDLKKVIDTFTIVYPTASTTAQPRVQYVQNGVRTFTQGVDMIDVSAGKINVFLSPFTQWDVSTGAPGTYSSKSGLFIDPKMWDMAYLAKPRHEDLAKDGSGTAGRFEALGLVRCLNPQGQGYVLPTS